ncbi:MAG: DUF4147 domain-containing protein [Firmicutes bacterium]|nr:DUF4147 domain-containing protein [Bacillota bacterium]
MTENRLPPADMIRDIFWRSVDMTDITRLIRKNVAYENGILKVSGEEFPLEGFKRVFLLGVGIAAYPMAQAFEVMLGDKISQGVIITPPGFGGKLEKVQTKEATSPLMDKTSFRSLRDLLFMAESATDEDLIILLLSKGTAEILESLPDTVSVSDYTNLLKTLRASGARKEEINSVKTHMSRTKGGQFLSFSHPATLISVIVSDEPGGDIWKTYQSPTYVDQTTFDDCRRILIRYKLPLKLPPSILNHFNLGIRKKIPETLKEGDEKLVKVLNYVIQHSSSFAADALSAAEQAGLSASILSTRLEGDAEQLGKFFGNIIKDIAEFNIPLEAPCAFIASGKTDHSEELRLEEICALAMSCAVQIDGIDRAWFLAGSSFNFEDGGSVGVVVNCNTINEVRNMGADPLDLIRERKAHVFFRDQKMLLTGKPNLIDCGDLYVMMVV